MKPESPRPRFENIPEKILAIVATTAGRGINEVIAHEVMHVSDHWLGDVEGIDFCEKELEERMRYLGRGSL